MVEQKSSSRRDVLRRLFQTSSPNRSSVAECFLLTMRRSASMLLRIARSAAVLYFLVEIATAVGMASSDGKYSIAMGISNTGVIVGGYFEGEFVHHGFLYENGIFSTIDIPGATYTIATGVNDSGDVVGYYLDASSECHGFLVNTIPVVVDVRPDSPSNTVNLRSRGVTPVAILSSSSFDAQEVNPATVTLAGARVDQQNNSGKLRCSTEDVNGDGLVDLVCKIVSDQLMVEAGHNVVVLRGQTFGGQLIRGEDVIRPVSE